MNKKVKYALSLNMIFVRSLFQAPPAMRMNSQLSQSRSTKLACC